MKHIVVLTPVQDLLVTIADSFLSIGWLLAEVRRLYTGPGTIVGLRSEAQEEVMDVVLTMLARPCLSLRDGDVLRVVMQGACQTEPITSDLSKSHFEVIKVIGKGGNSTVVEGTYQTARKRDTGQLYAIKIMSKQYILKEDKVAQINTERRILAKDSELFLVLDFCPGGELFFHLHNLGRLTEEQAKFYFGEILLAIEYLHSLDILYRDLKPENVLLDIDGHIRLTDFGVSKEVAGSKTLRYSFCGSPEYMSPEMLSGKGHNRSVDYYSLGAFLYEVLTGLPPFYHQERAKMFKLVQREKVHCPSHFSAQVTDLITRLLDKNPQTRLGTVGGFSAIKAHPWCANIPWDRLLHKAKSPPFIPNLHHSNFDPEYTSLSLEVPECDTPVMESRGSFSDPAIDPFQGFEYPEPELDVSSTCQQVKAANDLSSLSNASRSTKGTVKLSTEMIDSNSFRRHETLYLPGDSCSAEERPDRHSSQEFLADRVLKMQRVGTVRQLSPVQTLSDDSQDGAFQPVSPEYHSPKFCSPPKFEPLKQTLGPEFTAVKLPPKSSRDRAPRPGSVLRETQGRTGGKPKGHYMKRTKSKV